MTLAIVLVIAAALSLIFILQVAVKPRLQLSGSRSVAGQIQPIDVEAFRNLVDPAEDEYLRRRLPAAELRVVRRERLLAAAVYIKTAGRNAAALVQIGQSALNANDAQIAAAAQQLVNDALLLRRNATLALLKIYAVVAWPSYGLSAAPVVRGYEQLNGSAMLLGRLQNPAAPVRISAS